MRIVPIKKIPDSEWNEASAVLDELLLHYGTPRLKTELLSILESFGVSKISEIPAWQHGELLAAVRNLAEKRDP